MSKRAAGAGMAPRLARQREVPRKSPPESTPPSPGENSVLSSAPFTDHSVLLSSYARGRCVRGSSPFIAHSVLLSLDARGRRLLYGSPTVV